MVLSFGSNVNNLDHSRIEGKLNFINKVTNQLNKVYECNFDDVKLSVVCNNKFNNSLFSTLKPGFSLVTSEKILSDTPGFTITDITSICNYNLTISKLNIFMIKSFCCF